jgi:small-conductance mechanosensitive channel
MLLLRREPGGRPEQQQRERYPWRRFHLIPGRKLSSAWGQSEIKQETTSMADVDLYREAANNYRTWHILAVTATGFFFSLAGAALTTLSSFRKSGYVLLAMTVIWGWAIYRWERMSSRQLRCVLNIEKRWLDNKSLGVQEGFLPFVHGERLHGVIFGVIGALAFLVSIVLIWSPNRLMTWLTRL